eukprot:14667833-Ditylum_brightwellii.AAC.1
MGISVSGEECVKKKSQAITSSYSHLLHGCNVIIAGNKVSLSECKYGTAVKNISKFYVVPPGCNLTSMNNKRKKWRSQRERRQKERACTVEVKALGDLECEEKGGCNQHCNLQRQHLPPGHGNTGARHH